MEAKYYTPEIEEFYIGFEYEYKSDTYMEVLDKTEGFWVKEIYSCSCLMDGESENNDIESLIKEKNIRVKHLDRQDLEELGFRIEEKGKWQEEEEYPYIIKDKWLGTFYHDKMPNISLMGTFYSIKNKSELQKLMKQLNIQTNNC